MRDYTSFIKESLTNPTNLYWGVGKDVLNENWTNIEITKKFSDGKIEITTPTNKYRVLMEIDRISELLLLADDFIEPFKVKMIKEFKKNGSQYVKQCQYFPKFLGNVDMFIKGNRFGL